MFDEEWNTDGVCSTKIGNVLGNDNDRNIAYPLVSDIFKVVGAGQNFVHGGCSPQEMIISLVEMKVERGKKETSAADLATVPSKLIGCFNLIFYQSAEDAVFKALGVE